MSKYQALNEDELKAILDGMVEGIITINDKGIILSCNKAAETIFKYQPNELIGKNVSLLMPEPDKSRHDAYIGRYVNTDDAHVIGIGRNVTAVRKNGEHFPMRLSVTEYPAKVDGERWFIGSCQDITLQKRQEENFRRNIKMEALGKMTAGISHDFNNILAVIQGYAELLVSKSHLDEKLLGYAQEINKAAKRGAGLTSKMLSFSRNAPEDKEHININDIINDNHQILSKSVTSEIEIKTNLSDDLWTVHLNSYCLSDVILNLTINAKHAMPEGGRLVFSTSNVFIDSLNSQLLHIPKGPYVELSVADTGVGMAEEIKEKIFEPFFTTKGEKGTGLGLSQVYNFAADSGGTVKVYSQPGNGTSFTIYIPKSNKPKDPELSNTHINSDGINHPVVSGKVLVIDDDVIFRSFVEKMLHEHGYDVISVQSGKEALAILDVENIELVLSDVIMPEMDGYELAFLVKHLYPETKVVLCSGMPENKGKSITDDALYESLLQKPFDSNTLLRSLESLKNTNHH